MKTLTLSTLDELFSIHRLKPDQSIPLNAINAPFFSLSKTAEELSIVVPSSVELNSDECEDNWRCFKVEGPLDFGLTGILAKLSQLLAQENISIFAISTFDTDYILVKEASFKQAKSALSKHYNML